MLLVVWQKYLLDQMLQLLGATQEKKPPHACITHMLRAGLGENLSERGQVAMAVRPRARAPARPVPLEIAFTARSMSLCARALCAQTALATAATAKASSEAVVLCALKELAQLLQQARATPPCDPPPRAVAPVDASYYTTCRRLIPMRRGVQTSRPDPPRALASPSRPPMRALGQ